MSRARLGIVVTHPIQYQSPLFRQLAASSTVEPLLFFLSEHGVNDSFDVDFGRQIKFDVPLLEGYNYRILRNWSLKPSVSTTLGIINPGLPRLIMDSNLDAILVHGYNNVSHWLAYGTALASNIPYLLRGDSKPAQADSNSLKLPMKRMIISALVRNSAACLAIGKRNHAFYRQYGAHTNQIYFAPYSVDTDRFSIEGAVGRGHRTQMLRSVGLDPEAPAVLFAAKLQHWKRPADVVAAIDQVDRDVNLIVIGDGPLRPALELLSAKRPWMRMLGFVNQSAIGRWYGVADLFVLPSEREKWGLAVNEAMAAGAVPIVSDVVGCAPDLVTPDVGWVHGVGDIGALARAIDEGCDLSALGKRRLAAQRRSAAYGIEATARGIEAGVRAALSR